MSRYSKMKRKDVQAEVDQMVAELNKYIEEYKSKGKMKPAWEKQLARLQETGTKGRKGNALGRGKGLSRDELDKYASELHRTLAWDTFTPEGVRKKNRALRKAYETFMREHRDSTFTFDQFKTYSETMNKLKGNVLSRFNSDQVAQLYKEAREKNRRGATLLKIAEEVFENRPEGMSDQAFLDAVRERL